MIAPAAAAASVQILNDPLSAQAELVNAQTWAEAAGHITFPSSLQGDSVVALTAPPRRPCPARPPPGAPTNPGPGVDAESVPVLADRDQEEFLLTPTTQEVTGQTTRLCAYLLRGGVVQTRGSRRLTVALAKPPSPRRKHASGDGARLTASELLAAPAAGAGRDWNRDHGTQAGTTKAEQRQQAAWPAEAHRTSRKPADKCRRWKRSYDRTANGRQANISADVGQRSPGGQRRERRKPARG